MAFDKIWVVAESAEGKPLGSSLENLTKAREMGGTVEEVEWGPDAEAVAPELGGFGATKV